MKPAALALLLLATVTAPVAAADLPRPGATDPRIRTITYDPAQVFTLTGQIGYQMIMEFGPGERIENVAVGDSEAWQVTPNRRADLLFLKPLAPLASTNMAIVTNLRRYNFELVAVAQSKRRDQTYDIRFRYPDEATAAAKPPPAPVPPFDVPPPPGWNHAYSYSGAKANVPARVFDDGTRTYFEWPEGAEQPAVFVIDVDGKEALVNHITRGHFQVVERVAARFVLRNGTAITEVFNDSIKAAIPAATAPAERNPRAKRAKADGKPPT